ncbi:hypothetical protein [Vibrio sp. D431a]|uniref:hypothetical protein n=1 Tax=Vibrio sp. D431a TaxID=2837388 RepID=UPI002552C3AC|nr:hypothetical protein [Vibrio sp. D431a]MDK9790189.1 hypothetical protein [Vibrio sp. D431a]
MKAIKTSTSITPEMEKVNDPYSDFIDPEWLTEGLLVYSRKSGLPCRVESISRYGHSCSTEFIQYRNLAPTKDYPAGQLWTLELDIFIKKFRQ